MATIKIGNLYHEGTTQPNSTTNPVHAKDVNSDASKARLDLLATESKLEQVRALLSGVATETKLEQARALLATIGGKDFATQATLAQVKTELELVKAELQAVKTSLTDGTQKVQQSGSIAQLETTNALLATISHGQLHPQVNTWQQVQYIVRAGLADKVFRVGDQFVAEFDGVPVTWDVIGINHDTPTDKRFSYSLTIQAHHCLLYCLFDAAEPLSPDADQQQYGNNRYLHSAIRQWLNSSDATFNWVSQHAYDAPPTDAPYTAGGFLNRLDPELAAVLGAVDKQVARNTVTDGGGQDLFSDKVFLLSRVEVYGGGEGVVAGENPYDYYASMASSPTTTALDGRIKLLGSSTRSWWLRSPYPGSSGNPRGVSAGGHVDRDYAGNALGAAPACCIV